jgi:hypothetical protein
VLPWRLSGRRVVLIAAVAVALTTAACSSSPSNSASSTTSTASQGSASGHSTTTTGAVTTTTGTLLPQTASVTEFYSPTKNISCEIDAATGPTGTNQALCLTLSPAQSATLTASGTLTKCAGQDCLSNAGENTPTLNYGVSITLGSITCLSTRAGMTCTLSSGAGFTIATSGITPLGNVTVTTSTTSTTG